MMTKEMVLFESSDGKVSLPVSMDGNTVWLSQAQMALLFGKDVSVVNRPSSHHVVLSAEQYEQAIKEVYDKV